MNKRFSFLLGVGLCCVALGANAAVTVKKAAPVATKQASAMDSSASLMNTAFGLITTVQELNKKQRELTEECIPSSAEISWVDNMIKEWAKTGSTSASEVKTKLKRQPCDNKTGGYAIAAEIEDVTGGTEICFNSYGDAADKDMVWYGFPKVGIAKFCPDGSDSCKNKKTVSDIYEIFNLIDFEPNKDYKPDEMAMATKLMNKVENCSNAKLSAKKRAMWAEFLTGTLSNVGQKTNTGSILEQVQSTVGSGGGLGGALGGLSGLGGLATQFLDR